MDEVIDMLGVIAFQPSLPVRGATCPEHLSTLSCPFQPSLPVRGATGSVLDRTPATFVFQPSLPVRGATMADNILCTFQQISTLAPRAGSDPTYL